MILTAPLRHLSQEAPPHHDLDALQPDNLTYTISEHRVGELQTWSGQIDALSSWPHQSNSHKVIPVFKLNLILSPTVTPATECRELSRSPLVLLHPLGIARFVPG